VSAVVPQVRPVAIGLVGLVGLAGLGACGGGSAAPPAPAQPVCGMAAPAAHGPRAQCGPTLDLTPINDYHGDFTIAQDREDAVVLIAGDCTGTLIAAAAGPVVLTAGHCVGVGDRVLIAFNVEDHPDGDPLVTNGTVIEQAMAPDYALIALDQLPSVTPTPLTRTASDRLAIIQHPRGGPKVIAEGAYLAECTGIVSYTDLDTLVGSSGAGILTTAGFVVGVHTDGDCRADGGGLNYGWSAAAIVAASTYLQDGDIADR
jgi:hypothetical protein